MTLVNGEMGDKAMSKLAPMLAYIEQESDEKVDEIQVRADEDAKLEVKKVVRQQCEQIEQFYARKFRQVRHLKMILKMLKIR